MATPTVYVICDQNCKHEGMTKEQILTAIMQAVNEGTIGDVDAGFITTIKTINDKALKFFVGEQSAYDALTDKQKENLFAIITNDTTKDGLLQAIKDLQEAEKAILEKVEENAAAIAENTAAIENPVLPLITSVSISNGKGRLIQAEAEKLRNTACFVIFRHGTDSHFPAGVFYVGNNIHVDGEQYPDHNTTSYTGPLGDYHISYNLNNLSENILIFTREGEYIEHSGTLKFYKIGTI